MTPQYTRDYLSKDEQTKLIVAAKAGCVESRNRLVANFYPLVIKIVGENPFVDSSNAEDMVQHGMLELLNAVDKFDLTRGVTFCTFLWTHIFRKLQWKLRQDYQKITTRVGGKRARRNVFNESEMGYPLDSIPDDCDDSPLVDAKDEHRRAADLLDGLDARSRRVITTRVGLGCEPMTLAQVGAEIGVSKERVRQIEAKALTRMRAVAHA